MIVVSDDFKSAMTQPIKELQAFIDTEGVAIRDEDDLISYKISGDGGLCKTVMRKIEIKHLGNHNLLGKWGTAGFGVKLPSGAFEYLNYGSFMATEVTTSKDTDVTSVVGYDKMINAMTPYTPLNIEYPIDLFTYAQELCIDCGLELGNAQFEVNGDLVVERELFENINGITYRDIFTQIAQATASTCIVGNDDKIYFKPIYATGEQLTYDNMFKLNLEAIYGEINSVVLSRTPQEDNIFFRDEGSIAVNGLTEFRIENNEFLDKDRETYIIPLFNALKGVSYYPFEATTEGLGWYEIADNFNIVNDTGDVYNTSLFNFSITMDGSLKETLKTVADTKTQTQYQYATSISKRVKNTEIIVNKQDQYIQSLVTDVYEEDGVVNQKFTKVYQDINGIVTSVQNSGGNNLIKNSVMFDCDNDNVPHDWELEGDGSLVIGSNVESVSQHGFTLSNKKVSQIIPVMVFSKENPIYYSFSTKIKKGSAGSCYVKIYNDNEEHIIPLDVGQEAYYNEFEKVKLEPKDNYYIIEFYGSADSNATFTDNMFAVGEYKSQWTQANGEVMNTNVVMNKDGITVKTLDDEGNLTGDYTVISTVEFAGYSYVNGTKTKVFSLNKDITRVSKLFAEKEITMPPIKIVPITEGSLQGWAFVPST